MTTEPERRSLRYLLLRTLWPHRGRLSAREYEEVTAALTVREERGGFVAETLRGGVLRSRFFHPDEVAFYRRRQAGGEAVVEDATLRRNETAALGFWEEVLGIEMRAPAPRAAPGAATFIPALGDGLLAGVLILAVTGRDVGGGTGHPACISASVLGASTVLLFLLDAWPRWGRFATLAWLGLLASELPLATAALALGWAGAQQFDPDPRLRRTRSAAGLLLAIVCAGPPAYPVRDALVLLKTAVWDPWFYAFHASLVLVSLVRWVSCPPFRLMPFLFPAFLVGYSLDAGAAYGRWSLAVVLWLAATALAGSLARGSRRARQK